MKKSLVKKLVRMAKDGDPEAIEAVAELLEEISEGEVLETAEPVAEPDVVVETRRGEEPTAASGGNPVGSEVIRNEQAPQCGAATIENAENVVAIDAESISGILERLDKIIELLTPAAQDELNRARTAGEQSSASRTAHEIDPVEEIVSAVGEAVENAVEEATEGEPLSTAGGGNPERGEVAQNEQSSQWGAATIEGAGVAAEEISQIVEEIMEPIVTEALDPESDPSGDACGEPDEKAAQDALRAALAAVRPVLAQMPKKQRDKIAADIAAGLRKKSAARAADGSTYAALPAVSRRKAMEVTSDLGKKIMARRNPNYRN